MRISTSTCMYFNRPDGNKATIQESIRLCAEAGYDVMDMNFHDCVMFPTHFQGDNWIPWVQSIKQVAIQYGIEFSQGHSHFYNYCDSRILNREFLDEMIRRSIIGAGILEIPWLVFHAATDWESTRTMHSSKVKAIEYFKPIIEFAAKHNVGIALENLWEMNIAPKRRYTSFAEELMDLVESLPYENVGVCWDFEHSAIMQQNPLQAMEMVGNRLKATHISDFVDKKHDHILPFHGVTDWGPIVDALASIQYEGDLTYEMHRYTMRLPDCLVPSALRYSREVGTYLVQEIIKKKDMQDEL